MSADERRGLRRTLSVRTRALVASAVAVVLTGAFVLIGHDRGYTATAVEMSPGRAWLVSAGRSELTLLDGGVPQVVAHDQILGASRSMYLAQQDDAAYAIDGESGAVSRVDGATHAVLHRAGLFTPAPRTPQILATRDALYALDRDSAQVVELNTSTLQPISAARPVSSGTVPQGGAVMTGDRLWLTSSTSRDLIRVQGDTVHRVPNVLPAPAARLAVAGTALVAVAPASGVAELIDSGSGRVRESRRLPVPVADDVQVSGGPGSSISVVTSDGWLIRCTFAARACAAPIDLGTGEDDLGPAVSLRGRLYVPDHANGTLIVVTPGGAAPDELAALTHAGAFDLFARDDVLFFNDPVGAEAGTVTADGRLTRIDKFDDSPVASPAPATDPGGRPQLSATPSSTQPGEPGDPYQGPADPSDTSPATADPEPSDSARPSVSLAVPASPTSTPGPSGPVDLSPPSANPVTGAPSIGPTGESTAPPESLETPPATTAEPTGSGGPTAPASSPPSPTGDDPGPTAPGPSPTVGETGPGPTTPGPEPTTAGPGPTTPEPSASDTETGPPDGPPESRVIFTEDFDGHNRGWPDGVDPERGSADYGHGIYDVRSLVPGYAYWAPAPVPSSELVPAMDVEARARLVTPGQGGWGVWCRQETGDRYEFLLSHAGTAVITGPGGDWLGTKPDAVTDVSKNNDITGECSTTSSGTELIMRVNGSVVLRALNGETANWGDAGLHTFSFEDVPGPPLGEAIFQSFEIRRAT